MKNRKSGYLHKPIRETPTFNIRNSGIIGGRALIGVLQYLKILQFQVVVPMALHPPAWEISF